MRATITTTTTELIQGIPDTGGLPDFEGRTFVIFSPTSTGTVLVKPGPRAGSAPSMTDAARWDFSKAMLTYTLEPGRSLFVKTASGTVDLDVLEGGER